MLESLNRTGTWRTYSMADGLSSIRIQHVAEDSEGYLWFATWDNGVCRFDGDEFQIFTQRDGLCSDQTNTVYMDSQGRLWFGTSQGICWYDGVNFHHLEDDGIAGRRVQSIYEDREGRIWYGGNQTLGYYDGTVFHDVMPLISHWSIPRCRSITDDPEGHLWFGSEYPIRFDGTSFYRYEEEDGFAPARVCYILEQDHTGKVWIGKYGYGNRLWWYADGAFESLQVDLGLRLHNIQCDGTGRMWFCTPEGVLYQDGDRFSRFTPADGLPSPAVKSVFQDREHQYWFATWGGIGLYDAHSISVFDLGAKIPNKIEISQIVQDRRGDIWAGCTSPVFAHQEKSVFRFNGADFAFVGTEDGLDLNIDNCFAIYEDLEGYLWFGGGNGLFRYDGKKFEKMQRTAGLGERSVNAIAQDSQGQFLFGYWEKGTPKNREDIRISPLKLVYQQGEQFQTIFADRTHIEKAHFSLTRCIGTVIVRRNDEVWFHLSSRNFSDNNKGFARWHPEDGLKFYGIENGLIDDRVTDLLLDRNGNLWIATQGGLACFDGNTFRTFTPEDGLPNNRIHCVYEDRKGHLYLGTDGGVVHYDGQLFQTIKSPHIGSVFQILEDRDGAFWFGTAPNTVVRYRLRQIPPRVLLSQVVADQIYENPQEVIVSTTDQQVTFEYKGLSFSTPPSDMLYVYRLKGYDPDWQPTTRKMWVHYRDLPPGDYTFQVRAVDRDLNYSEIAQVRLSVERDPRVEALTTALNSQGQGDTAFIGQSASLHAFQIQLRQAASIDLTVLFKGETGVGKGLAARVLHALGAHSDGPFIQVNCGALPETLIDSELFGHERGAFTSAVSRRLGKVELAKDGTLFLDEIGDMTPHTQARLLRLLEDGTFERVGSSETLMVQARIVAATNRDLEEMVSAGDFREDLYYRLNAFPMYLPPLRERKEDIPYLAEFFKHRMATHLDKQIVPLAIEVIEVLQAYNWPGNVRELEHTIQRAVIVCRDSQIEVEDLGFINSGAPVFTNREIVSLAEFERDYILKVLKATNWRIKRCSWRSGTPGATPCDAVWKNEKTGYQTPRKRSYTILKIIYDLLLLTYCY